MEKLCKRLFFVLLLCIIGSSPISSFSDWFFLSDGVNGGSSCVACTLLVSLIWQVSNYNNVTYEAGFQLFCSYLATEPNKIVYDACKGLQAALQIPVSILLNQGDTPDQVCQVLSLCNNDAGYFCNLYPPNLDNMDNNNNDSTTDILLEKKIQNDRNQYQSLPQLISFCEIPGVEALCKVIERWSDQHLAAEDLDNDTFSVIPESRGYDWRGKDCNDRDANIHPGRKPDKFDQTIDSNCNGIYGIDNMTGKPYEELYCNDTQAMGVLLLGDSAGAHFHIPPEWMNVTEMSQDVFQQLYFVLLNELDWPHLSTTTAFYNSTDEWNKIIQGPVDSMYSRFVELNRCNKNDYANMGVNGARSSSMSTHLDEQVRRHSDIDKPVWINYELIGNDVCNPHPGMSHMTTPTEFYNNNLKIFEYLDANLPFGSKITANGLANGSVLYEAMHDRIHPIGALYNDTTYKDVYDYLNCLQISPCWGWMNSNATWRQRTTQRAYELNDALEALVMNNTFENITIIYIDWITNVTDYWQSQGNQIWQLIEPVDGFHPNQLSNALTTVLTWNWTLQAFPDWLPPVNPYNEELIKIFGR